MKTHLYTHCTKCTHIKWFLSLMSKLQKRTEMLAPNYHNKCEPVKRKQTHKYTSKQRNKQKQNKEINSGGEVINGAKDIFDCSFLGSFCCSSFDCSTHRCIRSSLPFSVEFCSFRASDTLSLDCNEQKHEQLTVILLPAWYIFKLSYHQDHTLSVLFSFTDKLLSVFQRKKLFFFF